jgi:hypothetical protein
MDSGRGKGAEVQVTVVAPILIYGSGAAISSGKNRPKWRIIRYRLPHSIPIRAATF